MKEKITMYTDGGSRNNPGPAAVGVWIETLGKKYGEYIGEKTNNEAEYEALVFGLEKLKTLLGKGRLKAVQVECFLDSELVVNQLNHKYRLKEKHIQEKFIEVWNLMLDFGEVTFLHVPREKNKIADEMVNEALDEREKQRTLI